MPSIRLFLGGLSDKVKRQDIGSKLSHYGPVLSIDLKEKTDPEGNILFRFAYVNVDAVSSKIDQCIEELHGTSWKGSHLRVERAKESFLERLNRERAARQQEETTAGLERSKDNTPNTVSDVEETNKYFKEHSAVSEKQSRKVSDSKHSNKRKDCSTLEKSRNISLHSSDQVSLTDSHAVPSKREKKKKKDEVEEKMLSSFRNFSSVWADSDDENDGDCQAGHGKNNEKQQDVVSQKPDEEEDTDATVDKESSYSDMMEKQQTELGIIESLDDTPTPSKTVGECSAVSMQGIRQRTCQPEDQQQTVDVADKLAAEKTVPFAQEKKNMSVKVAKDLSFGQNTSGFSLLAQFSRLNEKEDVQQEVVTSPVSVPRTLITVQQKVKKRPFFILGDDPDIEGAIEWMTQPITQEIIKEFEDVLPDLRQVIRTRSFRAKKEEGDARAQRRGPGRGRGRGQSRGRPATAAIGNPYRDHRWRERAIKK